MSVLAPGRAGDALDLATSVLRAAGCDSPALDAQLLIAHAIGTDRAAILREPERTLDRSEAQELAALVARRARREPVAYVIGRRGFRRIELMVDRRVLIPRPETELLVEVAVELAPHGGRVHDLGTGCGAIALALVDERPDLRLSASDASADAVAVAAANAVGLGAQVPVSHLRGLPPGSWDLVVANLPYVREHEWGGLEPEITRYEPPEALVAGIDGLAAIRELVAQARPNQLLAIEHAPSQAATVRALLVEATTRRDLAGRERVTVGRRPG